MVLWCVLCIHDSGSTSFRNGVKGTLAKVVAKLEPEKQLCAFLDNIYVLHQSGRVKMIHDELSRCLSGVASISLQQSKTRV